MNKITLILFVLTYLAHAAHRNRKEDKLLLSPIELIDLVRKEQNKNKASQPMKQTSVMVIHSEKPSKQLEPDDSEYEPVSCEDDKTLKNRKIWSRWSKWGDCSVTCGGGTITRYRVCVAGRCAPGEREEQRRPCARAPCHATFYKMTDDLRERTIKFGRYNIQDAVPTSTQPTEYLMMRTFSARELQSHMCAHQQTLLTHYRNVEAAKAPRIAEHLSCEDDKTLKNRKIWSRWSKWGDCSVTCGGGTITRYRVCVAGRCAPGEREEQRRPCARAPCHATFYKMTDDLREVE